ncbi:uncharacterized protein LOC121328278 [Polyodon spathula]|uniref:uncharacterized protein LOC121328278 n=1 Tax=Polyodon spathula TaxID=7913 RepID=UPI001B7E8960|nr:uncharacterized protein LOC121328278 [Polyodon spathula]
MELPGKVSLSGRSLNVHSRRRESRCVHSLRGGSLSIYSLRGGRPNIHSPDTHQQRENACWFQLHRHRRTACHSHLHQQRENTCCFHLQPRGGLLTPPTSTSRWKIPAGSTSATVGRLRASPTSTSRERIPAGGTSTVLGGLLAAPTSTSSRESMLASSPTATRRGGAPAAFASEGEEPLPPLSGAEQQELHLSSPPQPKGEEQELPLPSRQDRPGQEATGSQQPLHRLLRGAQGKPQHHG